jgi:hypothetical protein
MSRLLESLRSSSSNVVNERRDFHMQKKRKAKAENELLENIVAAVGVDAIEAISSIQRNGHRGINIGVNIALGIDTVAKLPQFFDITSDLPLVVLSFDQVLHRTTPGVIAAVLLSQLRRQEGTMNKRTDEVAREAATLEGILIALGSAP